MTKIFKLYQLPNLILQKLFPISKVRKYRTLKAVFLQLHWVSNML